LLEPIKEPGIYLGPDGEKEITFSRKTEEQGKGGFL